MNTSLEKDFTELNPYYTASRYPSYKINISKGLSKEKVSKYIALAKEVQAWLEEKTKS
jgi:HEPN domain-containing protein